MRHARQLLAFTLIVLTTVSSAFAADQHVVSPQQLAAAVNGKVAQEDADRAAIREALTRPQVRDAAKSIGVDVDKISARADTLSGPDLVKAADAARQVNHDLVGGASTVVISTTTIIIILLLVILLVVALK